MNDYWPGQHDVPQNDVRAAGFQKRLPVMRGKRKTQVSTGLMPGLEKRSFINEIQQRKLVMIDYDDSEPNHCINSGQIEFMLLD